jgi:hypothetical protein
MLLTDELGVSKERQKKIFQMADQTLSTSVDVITDVAKKTSDAEFPAVIAESEKGMRALIRADLDQLESNEERIVYGYFVGALAYKYSSSNSGGVIFIIGGKHSGEGDSGCRRTSGK